MSYLRPIPKSLRFTPEQIRENEKERIKNTLREDNELLNEILFELRSEKINKIKNGI